MKVSITGANGQLGRELQTLVGEYTHWTFHFADRDQADLTQVEQLQAWLFDTQPDVLINCAAYTNVNQAESEMKLAHQVNVEGVSRVAQYCREANIPLFHFSSDYVYHTEQGIPFRETDRTQPKGVYASTKLEGELQAIKIHPLSTIIRTSWVYSSYGHNFVKTMLRLGKERDELKVVVDQIGTPTYANDLARASLQLLSKWEKGDIDRSQLAGIFNYSNEGVCSWYDFALAIFEFSKIDCRVIPVGSDAFPSPVDRPHFSVLDKMKIKKTFGLEIDHWRRALERCLMDMS